MLDNKKYELTVYNRSVNDHESIKYVALKFIIQASPPNFVPFE